VSREAVVVVGDAHLGSASPGDEAAFHDFLDVVPGMGGRLIVIGDLFDFWFEYRAVIPRRPFKTLAKLAALAERGLRIELFGGNHDRWGGSFWAEDLKIPFYADGADLEVAGRVAYVAHGDGLVEQKLGAVLMHRITRSPLAIGIFRRLHPDLAFRIAHRLSDGLAETNRSEEAISRAADAQEAYARALLGRRSELGLVVLAHTHRQRLVEHAPGRFFLNPGQWMGERCFAVVSRDSIQALRWPERPQ
jgi:UDP-2,3-diacylglucosamine hydrolase